MDGQTYSNCSTGAKHSEKAKRDSNLVYNFPARSLRWVILETSQCNSEQRRDRNFYLSKKVWLTPSLGTTHALKCRDCLKRLTGTRSGTNIGSICWTSVDMQNSFNIWMSYYTGLLLEVCGHARKNKYLSIQARTPLAGLQTSQTGRIFEPIWQTDSGSFPFKLTHVRHWFILNDKNCDSESLYKD